MYATTLKRVFDVGLVFLASPLVLPVLLLAALAVRASVGCPIFFVQPRAGLHGRTFNLIKFRTMTDARDERGALLPDEVRTTAVGQFLRKCSLDEFPTFLNVLRGDMSLVGPRPLLVSYLPLYNEQQRRRHGVRPGVTGWAQVNGRNAISWADKFALDVWYVDNVSLGTDLKILVLTVLRVLSRSNITHAGGMMPPFLGNDDRESHKG